MTTAPIHPTLADLARPTTVSRARLYDAALIVGGSIAVALSAQVAIPMPSGVPITGQTFAVLLVGALLGSVRGASSLSLYLLAGMVGLPFFASVGLRSMTLGYLIAFIPAAFLVGKLAEHGWDRTAKRTLLMMIAGTAVIFAGGLAWLFVIAATTDQLTPGAVLTAGLWPYLPGAAIKVALAMALLPTGWKLLGRSR